LAPRDHFGSLTITHSASKFSANTSEVRDEIPVGTLAIGVS
jgi:hypothetical protein